MVARGRPCVMHSGGPPPAPAPGRGEKGGSLAERPTIGYRVAERTRLANRVVGEPGGEPVLTRSLRACRNPQNARFVRESV